MSESKRVMMLDIEATNLKADFGYLLCVAWKFLGEKKIHVVSIADGPTFANDPTDDAWVVKEVTKAVEDVDTVVFHYGSRFDYPYLQSRALFHNLPLLPRIPYVDTWRLARNNLALGSNRLASLARLVGAEEKTPLDGRTWVRAMAGHKPSIKYVVDHCKQDVLVLEQVYTKIRGLGASSGLANMAWKSGDCPTCGHTTPTRYGWKRFLGGWRQRYMCSNCGHTFTTPKLHKEKSHE
jgi:uncharacterized protein YprB with RNaseH-like and TPR domain/predicted RNA-binding Zn-ribbon protein involved in translation (DUF1610 family)